MKYLFTTLIVITLFLACNNKTEVSSEKEVQVNHISSLTLGIDENNLYGKFYERMRISPDGEYWLLSERIKSKLFVFRRDGSFVGTIGESGRGPSGIQYISGFDINDEHEIFIYDGSQRLIKVFDLKGNLLHSSNFMDETPLNPIGSSMIWYGDRILCSVNNIKVSYENAHNGELAALVNIDGGLEKVFGKIDSYAQNDNRNSKSSEIVADEAQNLLFSNLDSSPFYQVHDVVTGERLAYSNTNASYFKKPEGDPPVYLPISKVIERSSNTDIIYQVFLSKDYFIQHMQTMTEEWFDLQDHQAKINYLVFHDKQSQSFVDTVRVDATPVGFHDESIFMVEDFNPDNFTIGEYAIPQR